DGTARAWNAETGQAEGAKVQHDAAVSGVIARGSRMLTRSGNTARLWDIASGKPSSPPLTHDASVDGAVFMDESRVVTWSRDGSARLWDVESGETTTTLRHDGPVSGVLVDESQLLSWSQDGTARIWDSENGEALGTMQHDGPVLGARLDRTQSRVLTWSEDGTARIWHPDTGESMGSGVKLAGPVVGAIFNDGYMESFYFYWFLIGSVLFFISYTMWATPWVALGFELTPDYYERTRLMGVQFFIGQIPYLIAPWFLAFMTWSYFSSQAQGASVLALLVALTAVTLGVIPAIFLKERPLPPVEASEEGSGGLFGAIWNFAMALFRTMTSGPFLLLAAATFLVFNGFQLIAAFQSYVLIYYVMGGDQEGGSFWLGWTGTTQIIATFGVIPLVTWLANQIGKRRAFLLSTGIATLGYGLKWFCYSQTTPWLILIPTPLIAFSLGGLFTLMPSMIADVVDYDELKTNQRREGMYGSVYWLMVKLGVSLALIAGGLLLNATGFRVELGADQSAETLLWLRIYDVIVPMMTSLLAMLAMYFYPLVEARALEIRAELDARHAAAAESAT
ncbi:MAG: MFS transporter, partial [Myxococcota bacterium]